MSIKTIYTIILSLFLFSASAQSVFNENLINKNSLYFVNKISKGAMVQGNAVGFGGVKPQQSYYYDSLVHYSKEQELIELTNHPDAKVRCYAFKGLVKLNSIKIVSVIRKNESDSAKIQSQSGCMVMSQTVISYMLYSITEINLTSHSAFDRKYIVGLKEKVRYY